MASLRAHPISFLGILLIFGAIVSQSARGEENLRDSTSLHLIPADAAFYRTCLRNREQFQTVMQSNALRRIAEAPRMAKWLAALRARWDDPDRGALRQWFERPENRD